MKRMLLLFSLFFSCISYSQQVAKSLTAANGQKIGFYQYTPTDYNASVKYPLIIFLHGSGEVGNGTSDLSKVLNQGIPRLINQGANMKFTNPNNGVQSTFLVLSPQLSTQYGNWQDFYTDEMLKYAKANLSIDENRIYLTGLSLGGGGTWRYASSDSNHSKTLAAISPIAGTGETQQYFCWIAYNRTAVWAFHDMDDGTVPVGNTQYAQIQLDNCDPNKTEVRQFTYYPNGGHNAWDRAYDMGHGVQNPNLYEWFLMNPRKGPDAQKPVANAGSDVVLNYPANTTTLDGSASYDPGGGKIISYHWGPWERANSGDIVSPNSAKTTVKNMSTGLHAYILEVTNDKGVSGFDVVLVEVKGDPAANKPPVSNAGRDTTIKQPSDSAYLDGVDSYDPDGIIASYRWKKLSGPAGETIIDTTKRRTLVRGLKAGTYWFRLTTTDIYNAASTDSVKITVEPPPSNNKPPVANAGNDFSTSDNFAYLSAGASYDPDGSITAFSWTQVSGPNTATLLSSNTMFPTAQGLIGGTYLFRLVVTDNFGATAADTVSLQVLGANKPPVANAGSDQTIILPTNTATLDGSKSSDPDGSITKYEWTKVSGPSGGSITSPGSAKTQVSGLVSGTYMYQLKVTDNKGATSSAQVKITVSAGNNKPPVANAGNDFTTKENYAYLSAGASYDPDGKIATFAWTRVSGPNNPTVLSANTMFPTVQGIIPGTYVYKLVVTDNGGASSSDEVSFTVLVNEPPVIMLPSKLIVTLPLTSVSIDGSFSFDPDGEIVSYKWTVEKGSAHIDFPNVSRVNVSGLHAGTFEVKLTVTDNRGTSVSKIVEILVTTNKPPVAKAGFDFVSANDYVYLSGAGSYDPDGQIVSYKWTQALGPNTANIMFDNTMFPIVSNLVPGFYIFVLTVTDNEGFTSSDFVRVTVIPRTTETVVTPNTLITTTLQKDAPSLKVNSTLSLYPNPAAGFIQLALDNVKTGKMRVAVFDVSGKVRLLGNYEKSGVGFQKQLDVSKLSRGVYYVQVFIDGQLVAPVKQFIKL